MINMIYNIINCYLLFQKITSFNYIKDCLIILPESMQKILINLLTISVKYLNTLNTYDSVK